MIRRHSGHSIYKNGLPFFFFFFYIYFFFAFCILGTVKFLFLNHREYQPSCLEIDDLVNPRYTLSFLTRLIWEYFIVYSPSLYSCLTLPFQVFGCFICCVLCHALEISRNLCLKCCVSSVSQFILIKTLHII